MQQQQAWQQQQQMQQAQFEAQFLPPKFEEARCCMREMDCWNDVYDNNAGREKLEMELRNLETEYEGVREAWESINEEKRQYEEGERKKEFAEAKNEANSRLRSVKDLNMQKQNLMAYIETLPENSEERKEAADALKD